MTSLTTSMQKSFTKKKRLKTHFRTVKIGTESDIPTSMRLVEVLPMCQTSTGTTTATTNTSFRHRENGGFISTSPIQGFSDSYVSATSSVELRVTCEDGC